MVEWEIHYSESEDTAAGAYIFEKLFYITNTQAKQSKFTGLEGKCFDSLGEMKRQIGDQLKQTDTSDFEAYISVDIAYIIDFDTQIN